VNDQRRKMNGLALRRSRAENHFMKNKVNIAGIDIDNLIK